MRRFAARALCAAAFAAQIIGADHRCAYRQAGPVKRAALRAASAGQLLKGCS